jgi:hypothetical protein
MDIIKKMEMIRKTSVLSFSDYLNENNGFQIRMEDFDAELASAYKDASGQDMTSTISNADAGGSSAGAEGEKSSGGEGRASVRAIDELAKKLREQGVKVEADYFIKKNGSVKTTLPSKFVEKWTDAADGAAKDEAYFFYDGGLYWIRSKNTSTATPCNWPKWKSAVDASGDTDNLANFLKNFTSFIGSFGGMNINSSLDAIVKFRDSNDKGGRPNSWRTVNNSILYPHPFIKKDDLEGIKKVVDKFCDDDNWEWEDFATFNNILVVLSNLVSFDYGSGKFISAFKWICDNSKMSKKGPYLFKDLIYSGPNSFSDKQILTIGKTEKGTYQVIVKSYNEIEGYPATKISNVPDDFKNISDFVRIEPKKDKIPSIKSVICSNLNILTNAIYPAVKIKLAQMNASNGESLPKTGYKIIQML